MQQAKVLVIDGNNLLHRVYWTANTIQDSKETTHIYLFLNTLKSYIELFNPRKIIVCWDYREKSLENYRKMLDENYKAQRDAEKSQSVYKYMPVIIKLLDSLGIAQINPMSLEADDIMYWLATKKYYNETIIVTADTDLYQLVDPGKPDNIVYNPKKKREITPLYLKEHYNVNNGFEFILWKALRGDKADNLDGVKGIRSTKIQDIISVLNANFDLDSLVKSGLLKEEELEKFRHNMKMMKLGMDVISEEEENWYEECLARPKEASKEAFALMVKELEFWNIYRKIDYWYKTFNRIDFTDVFTSLFAFD